MHMLDDPREKGGSNRHWGADKCCPFSKLLFAFVVTFLLASGCSRFEFDNVPLNLSLRCPRTPRDIRTFPHVSNSQSLFFGDYNGDGLDELVEILNHEPDSKGLSLLQLKNHEFKAVRALNVPGRFTVLGMADADSDADLDVFFTVQLSDSFFAGYLPFTKKPGHVFLLGTTEEFPGGRAEHCSLEGVSVLTDFRSDGNAIFVRVLTPWTRAPRYVGLYFLGDSSRVDVPMGGMPISYSVADINNDGHKELLVGTYAPGNGAKANGMSDASSWLVVLSDSGKILHKQQIGDYGGKVFLSPHPVFSSPDSPPSVLLVSACYGAKPKKLDFVGLWSWNSRDEFRKISFPEGLVDRKPLFYSDPYTGNQHVVLLTRTGSLVDVDAKLRIVRTKKLGFIKNPSETALFLAEDLDGDRRPELVLGDGSFFYIFSADFRPLAIGRGLPLFQVFHIGKSKPPLFCYIHKQEGTYHFVHLEKNPLYIGVRVAVAGVLLFVAVVLPLSVRSLRRRAAREKAARTNAFRAWTLEAMDTGTVIFDAAGKLVSINRKAREMLALPGQVSGTLNGFAKQLHGTGLERVAELLRSLEKRNRDKIETEFTVKRGSTTQLWLVSAELLRDTSGRVVGKAVALRDVTETVRSQQIMSWVNLARRLAHEVKTPIASILLAAEKIRRLLKNVPTREEKRLQTYFDLLFREIERTRELAETMMQVTDLERSKREPVDVNAVVREAVELLAPQASTGVDIEVALAEDLPAVEGSRAQIALAVTNVLKNAIQAVDTEGTVKVRTFVAHGLQDLCRSDGAYVAVEIADSGEGIPEEVRDKIFEPYFSRKHSGTGLGLAIVKTILDDHKGCVEFESSPGVGTTFWLYFPAKSNGVDSRPEGKPE